MNDNTCYVCGESNSMLNDNWIIQLDGTYTHYHDACMKAQIEKLSSYGLELSMRVIWEDEFEMEGSILCINDENDGNGHFLSLRNTQGGVDEVPMSMLKYIMVNGSWIDFEDDASDIKVSQNQPHGDRVYQFGR